MSISNVDGCSPDSPNDIHYEYTDANILVDSVFERCQLEDLTLVLLAHTHTHTHRHTHAGCHFYNACVPALLNKSCFGGKTHFAVPR